MMKQAGLYLLAGVLLVSGLLGSVGLLPASAGETEQISYADMAGQRDRTDRKSDDGGWKPDRERFLHGSFPENPDREAEWETMPKSYTSMGEALPPEWEMLLPPDLFSPHVPEAAEAVREMGRVPYLFRMLFDAVGLRLPDAMRLLGVLTALILLSALLRQIREGIGGKSGEAVEFCIRLTVYASVVWQCVGAVRVVQTYFSQLRTLTGAFLPMMGTLYALGGNIGQAAVSEEILMLFLVICEYVSTTVTPPVCGICMAVSLMKALGTKLTVEPLGDMVKKWYTSLLTLVLFLLSLALSMQSVLTAKTDSVSMRGIRYAVVHLIPVVGGAVAGTLGTVAAGIDLMRGIGGVCGIILTGLLLLPTLIQLLLFRWIFCLASGGAAVLDCPSEASLIREMASLYGYLAAAVAVSAVLVLFALTLFTHSASVLGL